MTKEQQIKDSFQEELMRDPEGTQGTDGFRMFCATILGLADHFRINCSVIEDLPIEIMIEYYHRYIKTDENIAEILEQIATIDCGLSFTLNP